MINVKSIRTTAAWSALLMGSIALLVAAGCDSQRTSTPEATATAPAPDQAPTTSTNATLPPDGRPLFDFLMANIPELVAKVPCSCCPFTLAECYGGACPTTCGPCNEIGRHVYEWHQQGMTDDAIVARVEAEFPR